MLISGGTIGAYFCSKRGISKDIEVESGMFESLPNSLNIQVLSIIARSYHHPSAGD
jgi:hypothetical protein